MNLLNYIYERLKLTKDSKVPGSDYLNKVYDNIQELVDDMNANINDLEKPIKIIKREIAFRPSASSITSVMVTDHFDVKRKNQAAYYRFGINKTHLVYQKVEFFTANNKYHCRVHFITPYKFKQDNFAEWIKNEEGDDKLLAFLNGENMKSYKETYKS